MREIGGIYYGRGEEDDGEEAWVTVNSIFRPNTYSMVAAAVINAPIALAAVCATFISLPTDG
ncbi:hypothetical protein FACS1894184_11550 [Clostridia bacterium]|nr:hypothetical protein FACS1894184_11550 [Clostridia bacterium]